MNTELVAVLGLVVVFALSLWRGVNMGALGLVAAFVLGVSYYGLAVEDVVGGFPGALFITLVGVTFLFGIARANGTVDRLVAGSVSAVRGRVALVPWVFFVLAALITGIGAISAATNAILVPIALAAAYRYRVNPLLMGLCVLNGTNAGGFSPISVYFSIVDAALRGVDIEVAAGPVFALTFVANALLNGVAFMILGGRDLISRGRAPVVDPAAIGADLHDSDPGAAAGSSHGTALLTRPVVGSWAPVQLLTVAVIVSIVVLALTLSLDVGLLAITGAVLLALVEPVSARTATSQIAWSTVLLIGGMVTYIAALQSAGVVDDLAARITGISPPVLAALLILVVGGVVSAFASTNAMFVILVPLAAPLLVSGELGLLGFVVALCIASSAVDSSPFSTGGALVVANGQETDRDRLFRGLVLWGGAMVVIAPLASWLVFVVL